MQPVGGDGGIGMVDVDAKGVDCDVWVKAALVWSDKALKRQDK